jgi:hypothetical protein
MNISLTKAYDYYFIHNISIRMHECYASGCYQSGKNDGLKFFRFSENCQR